LSDLPTVHFEYAGDGRAQIVFENGDSEELLVTPLGSDVYRLEESSFCGEMRYLDVIRAVTRDDGALLFKEVVTRSELANESWILSKEIMASRELREILDLVLTMGGKWEQAFGGILIVHAPKESIETIAGQIRALHPKADTEAR
jgi:hypothetical protein